MQENVEETCSRDMRASTTHTFPLLRSELVEIVGKVCPRDVSLEDQLAKLTVLYFGTKYVSARRFERSK